MRPGRLAFGLRDYLRSAAKRFPLELRSAERVIDLRDRTEIWPLQVKDGNRRNHGGTT